MRVLMLGWEFPPQIAGGLGIACQGLVKSLCAQGAEVYFLLPRLAKPTTADTPAAVIGAAQAETLLHERAARPPRQPKLRHVRREHQRVIHDPPSEAPAEVVPTPPASLPYHQPDLPGVTFQDVPCRIISPYGQTPPTVHQVTYPTVPHAAPFEASPATSASDVSGGHGGHPGGHPGAPTMPRIERWIEEYDEPDEPDAAAQFLAELAARNRQTPVLEHYQPYVGDLVAEAHHYARRCVAIARELQFDVIHAHDWLTYPAGVALRREFRKPLVVHVHSTEFDRSGEHVYQPVYDLERAGFHAADRVVTVSFLTRAMVAQRYGVPQTRIEVIYNGVDHLANASTLEHLSSRDRIVLFLGRITMQKGPEYFVAAAARVLRLMQNVKFVMVGAGDRMLDVMEQARLSGIADHFIFTGFLRGDDLHRVYRMADVYVMPSVSEPFGIAPLEAICHDVPVVVSKTSGVSEVLNHVLKVDFWDIHQIANKILAVLRHPPLSRELRRQADLEVRRLTWDGAATKCLKLYNQLLTTGDE